MNIIYFLSLIFSFLLFILGLAQIFGFGWALFIVDFLFKNSSGSVNHYTSTQNNFKRGNKILGLLLITVSMVLFYFVGSTWK